MCGLAGIVLGSQGRVGCDYDRIRHIVGRLLVVSERRGPHAAGAAVIDEDGTCQIHKAPGSASVFIASAGYAELVARISERTSVVMGHTRWATQGTPERNVNNHPLQCGSIIGTHNGTITNAAEVSARFGLRREAEVDSETLFRLAERYVTADGIDLCGWTADLAFCRGDMAIAAVTLTHPDELLLLRGDRPLTIGYEPDLHLLAYASERRILEGATQGKERWSYLDIGPFQALRVCAGDIPRIEAKPFLV